MIEIERILEFPLELINYVDIHCFEVFKNKHGKFQIAVGEFETISLIFFDYETLKIVGRVSDDEVITDHIGSMWDISSLGSIVTEVDNKMIIINYDEEYKMDYIEMENSVDDCGLCVLDDSRVAFVCEDEDEEETDDGEESICFYNVKQRQFICKIRIKFQDFKMDGIPDGSYICDFCGEPDVHRGYVFALVGPVRQCCLVIDSLRYEVCHIIRETRSINSMIFDYSGRYTICFDLGGSSFSLKSLFKKDYDDYGSGGSGDLDNLVVTSEDYQMKKGRSCDDYSYDENTFRIEYSYGRITLGKDMFVAGGNFDDSDSEDSEDSDSSEEEEEEENNRRRNKTKKKKSEKGLFVGNFNENWKSFGGYVHEQGPMFRIRNRGRDIFFCYGDGDKDELKMMHLVNQSISLFHGVDPDEGERREFLKSMNFEMSGVDVLKIKIADLAQGILFFKSLIHL